VFTVRRAGDHLFAEVSSKLLHADEDAGHSAARAGQYRMIAGVGGHSSSGCAGSNAADTDTLVGICGCDPNTALHVPP